jgi:hypothetical protein
VTTDHLGLDVTDYGRSKGFYDKALAPLGLKLIVEPVPEAGGYGKDLPFRLPRAFRTREGEAR